MSSEVFSAAQPALLYLVPFTLLPLVTMAYLKVSQCTMAYLKVSECTLNTPPGPGLVFNCSVCALGPSVKYR